MCTENQLYNTLYFWVNKANGLCYYKNYMTLFSGILTELWNEKEFSLTSAVFDDPDVLGVKLILSSS